MTDFEFVGIPGSGKSTLRQSLLNAVNGNNKKRLLSSEEAFLIALKSKKDHSLMRFILSFIPSKIAIKHIQGILNLYKYQNEVQGRFIAQHIKVPDILSSYTQNHFISYEEKSLVIARFLSFLSFYQIINEVINQNIPVVFDSAFLQKSMSLFFSPQSIQQDMQCKDKDIKNYLDAVPLPKIIILVESDIETCIRRLKARPRGLTLRMTGLTEAEIKTFLSDTNCHFNRIAEMAAAHGVSIIRISNNMSLAEALQTLELNILALLAA